MQGKAKKRRRLFSSERKYKTENDILNNAKIGFKVIQYSLVVVAGN